MTNEDAHHDDHSIWLSRTPIAVAAALCGGAAIIGAAIAIYTFFATTKEYVPIYFEHVVIRNESKAVYLFAPVLFMSFSAIVLSYYALTWNRFARRSAATIAFYKANFKVPQYLNFSVLNTVVCVAFGVFQIVVLFQTVWRASDLLK